METNITDELVTNVDFATATDLTSVRAIGTPIQQNWNTPQEWSFNDITIREINHEETSNERQELIANMDFLTGDWTINAESTEIAQEQWAEARRLMTVTAEAQLQQIITETTTNETNIHNTGTFHRDDWADAISYATKNKEQLMTTNLKLNHVYSLADIMSYSGSSYQEQITYVYENDINLSADIILTNKDLEQNSNSAINLKYIDQYGNAVTISIRKKHIAPIKDELIDGMEWSNIRRSTTKFNQQHLLEQVRNRYAFFDRPTSGLSNIIIDNYAPKLMYVTHLDQRYRNEMNLPKTIYTMSPWFAQYFGATLVPTEQLCRILGYDLKALKNLITKVKRKDYTITFVGYGGTTVNTIHWLTEIMKTTQSVNLFKQVEIFEPDDIEISNLLRFPKNPYVENTIAGRNASKLRLLSTDEINLLSKNKVETHRSRIDGRQIYKSRIGITYSTESGNRGYMPKPNHIFYGAPGIDTRASFEDIGHFISATHNGNDAHLWLNPTQDSDLQVESYGLIQLTPFFMNQLRLAIGLLETLATEDLDLKEPDKLLLEYSFDGEAKLSTNRTYNFQLGNHSQLVATEEEAAAAF